MSLSLQPDPEEPAGGYGFFELPLGTLSGDSVTVAIFDVYGERWLAPSEAPGERIEIGNPVWQPDRHEFGPYEVYRHNGADWVRIGPEIVNKIEEYAPLRITVGSVTQDLSWPDDLRPRAGAAVLGGLQVVRPTKPEGSEPRLVGGAITSDAPAPESDPDPEPAVPEPAPTPEPSVAPRPGSRPRAGWVLLLALLALAVGAALWFFVFREDPADPPSPSPDPQTATTAAPDAAESGAQCSLAALSALAGGFDVTGAAIRACGPDVTPDTALRLIEEAAARDDPAALFLFGQLYDAESLDARIENLIGLTFEADLPQAVEYYGRAAQAGSAPAQAQLATACARLATSTATIAKGTYDDFCR